MSNWPTTTRTPPPGSFPPPYRQSDQPPGNGRLNRFDQHKQSGMATPPPPGETSEEKRNRLHAFAQTSATCPPTVPARERLSHVDMNEPFQHQAVSSSGSMFASKNNPPLPNVPNPQALSDPMKNRILPLQEGCVEDEVHRQRHSYEDHRVSGESKLRNPVHPFVPHNSNVQYGRDRDGRFEEKPGNRNSVPNFVAEGYNENNRPPPISTGFGSRGAHLDERYVDPRYSNLIHRDDNRGQFAQRRAYAEPDYERYPQVSEKMAATKGDPDAQRFGFDRQYADFPRDHYDPRRPHDGARGFPTFGTREPAHPVQEVHERQDLNHLRPRGADLGDEEVRQCFQRTNLNTSGRDCENFRSSFRQYSHTDVESNHAPVESHPPYYDSFDQDSRRYEAQPRREDYRLQPRTNRDQCSSPSQFENRSTSRGSGGFRPIINPEKQLDMPTRYPNEGSHVYSANEQRCESGTNRRVVMVDVSTEPEKSFDDYIADVLYEMEAETLAPTWKNMKKSYIMALLSHFFMYQDEEFHKFRTISFLKRSFVWKFFGDPKDIIGRNWITELVEASNNQLFPYKVSNESNDVIFVWKSHD